MKSERDPEAMITRLNLGRLLGLMGAWETSTLMLESSLNEARASGLKTAEAKAVGNLGDVFEAKCEWTRASEYYREANTFLRDAKDKDQLGHWLERRAELFRKQRGWELALLHEEEAMEMWRSKAGIRKVEILKELVQQESSFTAENGED
jgi:tetratricopeptide (TPR) repeat protein